ncbi:hypothetical protein E6B08_10665 [Pseudomonas putida]|uniref:Uncharacterized protein n=1 Tax=Pseudomonas putida TaxID=303 RepID=A0A4D6XBA8_PSEPU|nr:hypothetical protein [Pseudomonas putida]QCI11798.1 hypothetical protein E6B08_10665 [Pseudomonas putida]
MKFHVPRMVLFGLFAFAAVGSASATQMHASKPALAAQPAAVQAPANPWPSLASVANGHTGPMLAHDDRYQHDHRWDNRREEWRREQWRREQHRRQIERQREWERRHHRAMEHRYDDAHRHYRR